MIKTQIHEKSTITFYHEDSNRVVGRWQWETGSSWIFHASPNEQLSLSDVKTIYEAAKARIGQPT